MMECVMATPWLGSSPGYSVFLAPNLLTTGLSSMAQNGVWGDSLVIEWLADSCVSVALHRGCIM